MFVEIVNDVIKTRDVTAVIYVVVTALLLFLILLLLLFLQLLLFLKLFLKGVFAKNERGYRLNAIKKAFFIATNLTSICCVYKEKIVNND